jgi:glycerophosphoryl diester phosphodiesterase
MEAGAAERERTRLRRIGHKGADLIRPGNTVESFEAAVEAGVDMIELDVLWRRDGHPKIPASERSPLVVAHDWPDAESRRPLTLDEALDAFTGPPLDAVRLDLDLKLRGREKESLAALRERGLLERASVSTMEVTSLQKLNGLEPGLRLGWTLPKVSRDWTSMPWAKPLVIGGLISLRARLPGNVRRHAPRLGVSEIWAYHPVITPRLVAACHGAGLELIAWTIDDLERMRRMVDLGVDGICSNDPRLFAQL